MRAELSSWQTLWLPWCAVMTHALSCRSIDNHDWTHHAAQHPRLNTPCQKTASKLPSPVSTHLTPTPVHTLVAVSCVNTPQPHPLCLQWCLKAPTSRGLARWQSAPRASTSQVLVLPATAPSARLASPQSGRRQSRQMHAEVRRCRRARSVGLDRVQIEISTA